MKPITYAFLETTNYCNLSCSFCNREEVIGSLKHMALPNWRILLDKIKHHPVKEAKLMGMGEPFLHPQFDRVTEMFKETFPECFLIVATNCQYSINHNSKMRDKFEKSLRYIDLLYLSIDGFEDNYEQDRAPAKWNRLLKFLDDLQDINRDKCRIVINYVVNKYNIFDIPKIEKFLDEYSLVELRLNMAQSWDPSSTIADNERQWGYSDKQLDYLRENYSHLIKGRSEWEYEDCFWVNEALYTTVEGNIKMCCLNTGATPFGNIFIHDLDDVRNSKEFQDVKIGCNLNRPQDHCKNCSYKELSPLLKELGVKSQSERVI